MALFMDKLKVAGILVRGNVSRPEAEEFAEAVAESLEAAATEDDIRRQVEPVQIRLESFRRAHGRQIRGDDGAIRSSHGCPIRPNGCPIRSNGCPNCSNGSAALSRSGCGDGSDLSCNLRVGCIRVSSPLFQGKQSPLPMDFLGSSETATGPRELPLPSDQPVPRLAQSRN